MPIFYCNLHEDSHGLHEVHTSQCSYLPLPENRVEIGNFYTCREAIQALETANQGKGFTFDGCFYCCRPCHRD